MQVVISQALNLVDYFVFRKVFTSDSEDEKVEKKSASKKRKSKKSGLVMALSLFLFAPLCLPPIAHVA